MVAIRRDWLKGAEKLEIETKRTLDGGASGGVMLSAVDGSVGCLG